jgi:hypothetical protein
VVGTPAHAQDQHASASRPARGRRDLIAWLGLGLAVSVVLVLTETHVSGAHRPVHVATTTAARHATSTYRPAELAGLALALGDATTPGLPLPQLHVTAGTPLPTHIIRTPRAGAPTRPSTASLASASETPPPPVVVGTPTTTSPAPPAPSATTVTDHWTGQLGFPDDVATRYAAREIGGPVDVSVSFAGTAPVSLRVSCPGGTARRTGVAPLAVTLSASAGQCTVVVGLPIGSDASVTYRLDATVDVHPPASS